MPSLLGSTVITTTRSSKASAAHVGVAVLNDKQIFIIFIFAANRLIYEILHWFFLNECKEKKNPLKHYF